MIRFEPISKPYDYKSLIKVYIYARYEYFPQEKFQSYYLAFLSKLEELFEIKLYGETITLIIYSSIRSRP